MGICLISKRLSFSLISTALSKSGLFQNEICFKERCLYRLLYHSASLALLSDETILDSNPGVKICKAKQIVVRKKSVCMRRNPEPYRIVVSVLKSLNWMVAREMLFSTAVKHCTYICVSGAG